ncbi:MAG TPA: hypothetical protein VGB37_15470, partial [Candidatus Lokiarchaeia archaeon]
FMDISKKKRDFCLSEPQVYYFDYLKDEKGNIKSHDKVKFFYKPIDILKETEFLKIFVYITGNRKPKNSFSLIAVGNSYFNEKVIKIPYSYGVEAHIDEANIRTGIKDFETEEQLKNYLNKNKSRILKEFIENHSKIEERYKLVMKEVENKKEWEIAYLENEKEYYEKCVSRGNETDEYKEVLKALKRLKNE